MYGEHALAYPALYAQKGSSPHVRGARIVAVLDCVLGGDHPRMYGEHESWAKAKLPEELIIPACTGSTVPHCNRPCALSASSPHVRGALGVSARHGDSLGSSPHVRGARNCHSASVGTLGTIPACTGSTSPPSATHEAGKDDPRMYGEHLAEVGRVAFAHGIIPRMYGEHDAARGQDAPHWGSSPHVRGARRGPRMPAAGRGRSSPHVRGAPAQHARARRYGRSSPACTGSTSRSSRRFGTPWRSSPACTGST